MRIGHGYDAHRTEAGKPLVIGGVSVECDFGLKAHSDGDVLIHALSDAVLGAGGLRDIGYYYPDTSEATLNMDSRIILSESVKKINSAGFTVSYADCTVIAQRPRLSEYIESMRDSLALCMNMSRDRVNVKATTEEKMGFTGSGEGISAHAVVLLEEI